MINQLKIFFYPPSLTYMYDLPKDIVLTKINEVLKKKTTLLSGHDMRGHFLNHDTFVIDIISMEFRQGPKLSSRLTAQVIELKKGTTHIKTKARPSSPLYLLFFVSIVVGLVYFYKFIETGSTGFFFWSLGILIIGPAASVGFERCNRFN